MGHRSDRIAGKWAKRWRGGCSGWGAIYNCNCLVRATVVYVVREREVMRQVTAPTNVFRKMLLFRPVKKVRIVRGELSVFPLAGGGRVV